MPIAAITQTELQDDWWKAALRVQEDFNTLAEDVTPTQLDEVHVLTPTVISGGEQSALQVLHEAISESLVDGGKDTLPSISIPIINVGWKYILPEIVEATNVSLESGGGEVPYTAYNATYGDNLLVYTSGTIPELGNAGDYVEYPVTDELPVFTFTVPALVGTDVSLIVQLSDASSSTQDATSSTTVTVSMSVGETAIDIGLGGSPVDVGDVIEVARVGDHLSVKVNNVLLGTTNPMAETPLFMTFLASQSGVTPLIPDVMLTIA